MAKKYKCPYCEKRDERAKLVSHIEKYHEDLMPEGYSGTRVVFELINHKTHGTCRVCGKQTGWNEKSGRFDVLCDNPKCKEKMREEYKKNMLRVRGTYNILNDPEQQQKMLANRSISGKYKYSDGTIFTYTGSYEKNCIEFMDQVLNIPSKDIMMPGPTLEYIYNGEKHLYIGSPSIYTPTLPPHLGHVLFKASCNAFILAIHITASCGDVLGIIAKPYSPKLKYSLHLINDVFKLSKSFLKYIFASPKMYKSSLILIFFCLIYFSSNIICSCTYSTVSDKLLNSLTLTIFLSSSSNDLCFKLINISIN